MQFEHPEILYWLWGIIPFIGFLAWTMRRKRKMLKRFVQKNLVPEIAGNVDHRRYKIKNSLLVLAFALSVIALARPQWGFEWQEVKRQGIDILIVIDTSKSMLTKDVKPNRLERTKLAVRDLVRKLRGDRIGLVAFSGKAYLVCPLTADYNGFLLSLQDLDIETIPRGGTNLPSAIEEIINIYGDSETQYKAAVLLTDGDNLEGDPIPWVKQAKARGLKLYCVGVGTPEGEMLRVINNWGEEEFMKDDRGNFVKSRLNEKLLQEVALLTGGIYVRGSGVQFGLDLIYERELSKFQKKEIDSKVEKEYYERFQIPLSLALLLILVESCISTRRKEE